MNIKNNYRHIVSAIILDNEDKVLVTHNKSHPAEFWKFPQGGVESEETEKMAILREMSEELSANNLIIVKKCDTKYRYEWPSEVREKKGYLGPELTYFIINCPDPKQLIPNVNVNELDQIKWVDKKELANIFSGIPEFIGVLNRLLEED